MNAAQLAWYNSALGGAPINLNLAAALSADTTPMPFELCCILGVSDGTTFAQSWATMQAKMTAGQAAF